MQKIRGNLSYANVVASLALFLALTGGAAFAASHLGKNTVGPKQIKPNAITTAKIKNGAVTGAKIKTATLGTVPNANAAARAASAGTADNANALGGLPASAYASSKQILSGSAPYGATQPAQAVLTLPGGLTMGTKANDNSFIVVAKNVGPDFWYAWTDSFGVQSSSIASPSFAHEFSGSGLFEDFWLLDRTTGQQWMVRCAIPEMRIACVATGG